MSATALALNIVKIKRAFPELPEGWYITLEEALDDEKFTDQRLTDAVKNLIRTCVYPRPTIANLLNFDKTSKVWTYEEALAYSNDFSTERRRRFWNNLELIDSDKRLWKEKQ